MSYTTGFYEGRLGIGLSSTMGMGDGNPRYPLDINGDIRLTGSIINGDGQVLSLTPPEFDPVGLDANNSLIYNFEKQGSHTGGQNILIGKHAGTDLTTGWNNFFVGIEAGSNLTTGNHNIAMGYYALRTCTTRSNNVMIGEQAGREYKGGDHNIGIGTMSMYNSGGSHNISMGYCALQADNIENTARQFNIALGYETLKAATSCTYNVAIGYQAGKTMTTGTHNVCIGTEAGQLMTTTSHNIYIGYHCGKNATGFSNTLIGCQAGTGMTSGLYNTVFGYQANQQSGLPGNKSMNTMIGCQAGFRVACDNNTAVGYRALYNKKAYVNTAIGYQCMGFDSPDSDHAGYNTAVGYNALRNVEGASANQGCYNTVMGHCAAQVSTTGYKNVIIGANASLNGTHVNQCVIIGMNAGYNLNNHSANTMIGYYAGYSTTSSNCTFIGYQAGQNVGNSWNVAVGYNALAAGAGNYNVAIGDQALSQGTIDGNHPKNYNVAVGYGSLYNARKSNNVGVGHMTGFDITTGEHNTCLGYYAGKACTTALGNTCIGSEAGKSITASGNSVIIGYQAGTNTTAEANTALGFQSLYTNVGGLFNTAIGYRSCYGGSGHSNVGVGIYTLHGKTSGAENTAIGTNSQRMITTGSYNVSLGRTASYSNTTGSYNISIGSNSGAKTADTGNSYRLYIGNQADNDLYRGVDSFIYGNMTVGSETLTFNANVGIGTDDPMTNLDVTSSGTNAKIMIQNDTLALLQLRQPTLNKVWNLEIGRTDGEFSIRNNGGEKIRIDEDGNVGIGTTSPAHPLHIASQPTYWIGTPSTLGGWWSWPDGGDDGGAFLSNQHYFWKATNFGTWTYLSMRAAGGIWTTSLVVSSDERIKENIVDVPDNLALQMVRDIPCKYYEYRDKRERGLKKTIGFIAQEVKEVLPMAVNIQKEIIPNELRKLKNISWDNNKLTTDLQDVSGVKYRFYVSNDPSGNDEIKKEVIGNSDNTFTFDVSYNNVFCYGKEVDDFHTLDKQKIFTLHHSAIQELDKKVIALENENTELKAELAAIKQHLGI